MVGIIERYNGLHYTREKAKKYVERAKRHLHLIPNLREKETLHILADYVLERRL